MLDLINGSTIVRTLVSFDDETLRLKTYQPAAASTLPRENVRACYPIIGRMKSRDFDALANRAEAKCEPS